MDMFRCLGGLQITHQTGVKGPRFNSFSALARSFHYVETVEKLDFNQYIQLSRNSRGKASDSGVRGTGFHC